MYMCTLVYVLVRPHVSVVSGIYTMLMQACVSTCTIIHTDLEVNQFLAGAPKPVLAGSCMSESLLVAV